MTDRLNGVYVTFNREIREDDAQCIIDAIKMIKHVADVKPFVSDMTIDAAKHQVKHELQKKLIDVVVDHFT